MSGIGPIGGIPGAGYAPLGPRAPKDATFTERLEGAVKSVNQAQQAADDKLTALATGKDIDLHGTMIALEEADITLRAMVTVRDKVVEAYQQIMNMSI